jgi:hypothetical protein
MSTSHTTYDCQNNEQLTKTGTLLFTDLGTPHTLTQPRHGPQEVLLIVGAVIRPRQETTEAPPIGLTNERAELGMLKEAREDIRFEVLGLKNAEGSAVIVPGDDVLEFGCGQNGVHLVGGGKRVQLKLRSRCSKAEAHLARFSLTLAGKQGTWPAEVTGFNGSSSTSSVWLQ